MFFSSYFSAILFDKLQKWVLEYWAIRVMPNPNTKILYQVNPKTVPNQTKNFIYSQLDKNSSK